MWPFSLTKMLVPLITAAVLLTLLEAEEYFQLPDTGDRPPFVTSPGICLRELECPETQFCTLEMPIAAESFVCRDRLGLGEECDTARTYQCKDGLFCRQMSGAYYGTCAEQISLGGSCGEDGMLSCAGNMTSCRPSDNRCALMETASIGQTCTGNEDCQQSRGHYCQAGVCALKKPTGAACGVDGSEDECEGLCVTGGNPNHAGVCAPAQLEGGMCREDRHCKQPFPLYARTDRLVCNRPRSDVGMCVRASRLILSLGATCNPSLDTCDSERDLGCRWAASIKRYVCQHKKVRRAYCTPGSPFSNCYPSKEEKCVKGREYPGFGFLEFNGFYGCRSEELLSPGFPCTATSRGGCLAGSTCELIPGVQRNDDPYDHPTRYCVRTVGIGESCANKFSTKCDANLSCVTGLCVVSGSPVPSARMSTHADLSGDCSELPCIPWTIPSTINSSDPSSPCYCELPSVIVEEGQECIELPLVNRLCATGLVCRRNNEGTGSLLCRKPALYGAKCGSEDDCEETLRCDQEYCYDPTVTAPVGLRCDPAAGAGTNRCTVAPSLYDDHWTTSLRCLPKGTGFICQRTARLYEKCDKLLNIGCIDGAVCSCYGVCMPPS